MTVFIAGIKRHSSVNGPGVRYVVFLQGCLHHCIGCQNPETWALNKGNIYQVEDIVKDILATPYIDGVTLSGGDPLIQAEASYQLVKALKENNIDIWLYTGYTYEEIIEHKVSEYALLTLNYIDVLIDGRFILSLLSDKCIYRGSTNQRLIDVKSSLKEGKVIQVKEEDFNFNL